MQACGGDKLYSMSSINVINIRLYLINGGKNEKNTVIVFGSPYIAMRACNAGRRGSSG
jgi:hypothetical protein